MATSSLKKSFVISTEKEASAFVKLFADSLKNPPEPLKEVDYSILSKDELKELVSENVRKS